MLFATITTDWIMAICAIIATPLLMIQTIAAVKAARGSPSAIQPTMPGPQTAAKSSSIIRVLFNAQTTICLFFLVVSSWRLCVLLSATSLLTRREVFSISVFVGLSVLCILFFFIRLMIWLALRRFKKENPPAGNVWL
jgi:Na+/phosphate symporter